METLSWNILSLNTFCMITRNSLVPKLLDFKKSPTCPPPVVLVFEEVSIIGQDEQNF